MLRRRRRLPWRRRGRGQVWPIWRSTIRSIRSRFLKKQLQDQAGKPFEAHGLSLKSRRSTPEDSISKAAAAANPGFAFTTTSLFTRYWETARRWPSGKIMASSVNRPSVCDMTFSRNRRVDNASALHAHRLNHSSQELHNDPGNKEPARFRVSNRDQLVLTLETASTSYTIPVSWAIYGASPLCRPYYRACSIKPETGAPRYWRSL